MNLVFILIIIISVWLAMILTTVYYVFIKPIIEEKKIQRGLILTQYQVKVPRNLEDENKDPKALITVMEQVYNSFTFLKDKSSGLIKVDPSISLEIVSPTEKDEIHFYMGVPKEYETIFEKQLHGVYPNADLTKIDDYNVLTTKGEIRASYLKFNKPSIIPIKTYQDLEVDPLSSLTSALSKIYEEESAVIQILIKKSSNSWVEKTKKVTQAMRKDGLTFQNAYKKDTLDIIGFIVNAFKSTKKEENKDIRQLTASEEDLIQRMQKKTDKTGFEVNIRLMTISSEGSRSDILMEQIKGSFSQFVDQNLNSFKFIDYSNKNIWKFIYKFIFRIFEKGESMILNTEELTSLFHIPTSHLQTPKIQWVTSKASFPPANLPKEGLVLGINVYRGEEQLVRIQDEDRRRHMYVIGQTGTGKTSFMKRMIELDLKAGRGLALLDPNGDFAEDVLGMIPKDRYEDVIYFNPQDIDYPLGLNILEARTPEEKDFLSQEMISIFYRLVSDPSMIGPIFEHNMRMAMSALMDDVENPRTIVEIPKLFTDDAFRAKVLENVHDPIVKDFWEKEFPAAQKGQSAGDTLGYLLSKLGRFIENEMVRNIIGQPKSSFDFQDIMNSGKILIANLSKGAIGDMNSNLLGMLLVSKLQMAAFKRSNIPEDQRRDFYLYLDEFQNFTTDSVSTILSEARKYRLDMILAHQFIGQLPENIRTAIFGNVGTTVAFRIGTDDAEVLEQKMKPDYSAYDLVNMDNLKGVMKLMIDGKNSKAFNFNVIFASRSNPKLQEAIKQLSRLKYGTPVDIVTHNIKSRNL